MEKSFGPKILDYIVKPVVGSKETAKKKNYDLPFQSPKHTGVHSPSNRQEEDNKVNTARISIDEKHANQIQNHDVVVHGSIYDS